jgi:hypothetical protein
MEKGLDCRELRAIEPAPSGYEGLISLNFFAVKPHLPAAKPPIPPTRVNKRIARQVFALHR